MGYKRKARILFLSLHNACRSQMAEGLANHLGEQWMEARSAGFDPRPLDPLALEAMAEVGIDLAGAQAKEMDGDLPRWADLVVTLDNDSLRLRPPLPAGVQHRHYAFDNLATGDLAAFRELRDRIRVRIEGMIGGMKMLARDSRPR